MYRDEAPNEWKPLYTAPISEPVKERISEPVENLDPVAWQFYQDGRWHNGSYLHNHRKNTEDDGYPVRDLYTAPPKREWVWLTDDDMEEAYSKHAKYQEEEMNLSGWYEYAEAIEAKLKEKNGG